MLKPLGYTVLLIVVYERYVLVYMDKSDRFSSILGDIRYFSTVLTGT